MNHRQIVGLQAITRRDHNCRVAMKNTANIMDQIGIPTNERTTSFISLSVWRWSGVAEWFWSGETANNKGLGIYTET